MPKNSISRKGRDLNDRPIAIDLFCGAGGMSLGFEQAGFDIVAAVEFDPIHAATHEFNFPECKTICSDIRNIKGDEIRSLSNIEQSDIDLVFGGAPCQGFSMIGKRALDDPRNSLVKHFMRIVLELKPKYFVFENVPGLTTGKHKQILLELMDSFSEKGYKVKKKYQVLNAANFGVPQSRKRLILMGSRQEQQLPDYPKPKFNPPIKVQDQNGKSIQLKLRDFEPDSLPIGPTVWDAIGDLPEAEQFDQLLNSDWVKVKWNTKTKYALDLRFTKKNEYDFSYERKYDHNLLSSSMRTEHNKTSRERFSQTAHGKVEPISRFLKLDPNGLCNTLRAGTASDRGAYTSPRPIHPFSNRVITVREAARLHSYPDWFRFHRTKWHGMRQVGNSVPPLLAKAVGLEIIRALGKKPSKPSQQLILSNPELIEFSMTSAAQHFNVDPGVVGKRTRKEKVKL